MINEAGQKRDFGQFEELMGVKMSIDAHIVGKNTLAGYRQFFTFTGALFMVMNNNETYISLREDIPKTFENIDFF